MSTTITRNLLLAVLVTAPALALAADPAPDIKGRWTGKSHTVVAGNGGHWPNSKGTFEKPALVEKDVVMEITGQDGRRFWGVTTLSGGGETTGEPFIGALTGKDSKTVVIADTDGYFHGEIDGDTFAFCYAHAGGKTQSSVVSCTEVKRAK